MNLFFNSIIMASFILAPQMPKAQAASISPELSPPSLNSRINNELVYSSVNQIPNFDLPVTYNSKVKVWINFFQTRGKRDFTKYLERSSRYLPKITPLLEAQGLPQDLAYLAMIESGFSSRAVSSAEAVGYWQFMKPTAQRYGLKVEWWIDERKDIVKSTLAAANYLNDLYKMFNSWYLAASAYNMGEGRVKRLVKKYNTTNYWVLSKKKDFPKETEQYIPKLIAAMLIAKAPKLYGFRDLNPMQPTNFDYIEAPGGTDLERLALYLGIDKEHLTQINPEITKGFIPQYIPSHKIRIPSGKQAKARKFVRSSLVMSN
ncbi:MAG: lytic transglycosylase domain-containing protein [Bdellovibrionales bacterium]|nr:lytic transglycosylase domain-containing protein [Bdellovibrionales bacterium]